MTNESKKHLTNLYLLALSDGDFNEKELEVILEIANEKGFSKEDFEKIILNPIENSLTVPNNFTDKVILLYDFVKIILADGKIEDKEMETFLKFCNQFSFTTEESKELFEWLIELANRKVSDDKIQEEINNLIKN